MRTQKRSNRARWLHESASQLSDKNERNTGDNVVFTNISSSVTEAGNNYTDISRRVCSNWSKCAMESWHKNPSSLRNERSGRKSRPQSERRNSNRTSAWWIVRWQDTIREKILSNMWWTINSLRNIVWEHADYLERQVKNLSVWKKTKKEHS